MKSEEPKTIVFSVKTVDGNRYYFERECRSGGFWELSDDICDANRDWIQIDDGGVTRLFWKNNIVCITRKEKV